MPSFHQESHLITLLSYNTQQTRIKMQEKFKIAVLGRFADAACGFQDSITDTLEFYFKEYRAVHSFPEVLTTSLYSFFFKFSDLNMK